MARIGAEDTFSRVDSGGTSTNDSGGSSNDDDTGSGDVDDGSGSTSTDTTRNALEGLGTSEREIEEESAEESVDQTRDAIEGLGTSERELRENQREEAVDATRNALEGLGTSASQLQQGRGRQARDRTRNALEGLGTSERSIVEDQVRTQLETQGRNPDRFDINVERNDEGGFDVSADRREFTDIDFSLGFGDENVDEVERAAEGFEESFTGFFEPSIAATEDSAVASVRNTAGLKRGIIGALGGLPKDALETTENALFLLENKQNPGFDTAAESQQKTENINAAADNVVDIGSRSVEFYRNNPDKIDELAGNALGGALLGTGASSTLRRIDAPRSRGSFLDDTRGQADFGTKTKTKELVIDEDTKIDDIDMSQLSKKSQVDVLRELNKQEVKTPEQRAKERLPDADEFPSIDEYQSELARATARERLPDADEFPSIDEYQRELDQLSDRLLDEIGTEQTSTTAASDVPSLDGVETTAGAVGAGGGVLGGVEAVSEVEPQSTQRSTGAGTVGGLDSQLEDVLVDADQEFGLGTTDVLDDLDAVDVTADDITQPGADTSTISTPTTTTIPTTDVPTTGVPITDFPETPGRRRLPEMDFDDDGKKKKKGLLSEFDTFEREFESPIATPEEIVSGDIEEKLDLGDI